MFDNRRVLTNGINAEIPLVLQVYLWSLVEKMDVEKVDYLQVFELEPINESFLKIVHSQALPPFAQTVYINTETIPEFKAYICKIYIIDEGDVSTMLFDYEY